MTRDADVCFYIFTRVENLPKLQVFAVAQESHQQ